jgi:hypothetical protein
MAAKTSRRKTAICRQYETTTKTVNIMITTAAIPVSDMVFLLSNP